MKARVLVTTLVSFLLLCAVVAAGLNAVFTVTSVKTEFSVVSDEGQREVEELKGKLDGFVGKSTTFLDEEEVRAIIAAYPCMRADKIEKRYPSTLEVSVSERKEAFAVLTEHGYATLSDDGILLYYKDSLTNRAGGENILLEGFGFPSEEGKAFEDEKFSSVLKMYGVFTELLQEARANVVSVSVYYSAEEHTRFTFRMREGIVIEIDSPSELTEEKARAALLDESEGYLARSDGERLRGRIAVIASGDTVMVDYDKTYV